MILQKLGSLIRRDPYSHQHTLTHQGPSTLQSPCDPLRGRQYHLSSRQYPLSSRQYYLSY